jgi:hypothetical protein
LNKTSHSTPERNDVLIHNVEIIFLVPEYHSMEAHFTLFCFKECTIVQCEGIQWEAAGKHRYEHVKEIELLNIPNEQTR